VDALASLVHEVRADGALFGRSILTPPWRVRFQDRTPLKLVTLLRGDGWIVPDGGEPVRLAHGEVAIVTGAAPFTVTDDLASPAPQLYVVHGPDGCTDGDGVEIRDEFRLGTRTCGTSLDGPTVLLTGSYQARGQVSRRLLGALPRVLLVPHEGELCAVLDLTVAEVTRNAAGQQAVLDRLLDLLLLTTLREWFARPEADPPAWYRALGDPVVGHALRLLHDRPADRWSVASLAAEAGVSRATLARRFADLVGEPPMAYLTSWRLSLAADLLARTDDTIGSIARQVGYESGFGLSVAFKRVHGTRPSDHRAALAG
jgi:AraC-like DNA-binding protein